MWDALGHRFFKMPLPEAEQRTGGRSKSFIAELMPRMPVYVSLLSKEAQWAMGQLHPDAELPFGILVAEGFDVDSYVDIFDGGPIAEARVGMLRSVVSALNVALRGDAGGEGEACLVARWSAQHSALRWRTANSSTTPCRCGVQRSSGSGWPKADEPAPCG